MKYLLKLISPAFKAFFNMTIRKFKIAHMVHIITIIE